MVVRIADKVVVVTGDVAMDWNLAHMPRRRDGLLRSASDDTVRAYWQRGGAALLADLVEAVAGSLRESKQANWTVRQTAAPREPIHPGDERFVHSYAMWSLQPYTEQQPREAKAWRVEEYLGYDRPSAEKLCTPEDWKRVTDDTAEATLVVLDDAGPGFRDCSELWPLAITTRERQPWILVKVSDPVAQGALWERLHDAHADRLIVVMTVKNLRRTEVQISRELSWERTAQDLYWELVHNPRVNALSSCAHVVVSFGPAGAILLSGKRGSGDGGVLASCTCSLIFDEEAIEGLWESSYPGGMIGDNTCLMAALARELMKNPDLPDIHHGIQTGLAAMRRLHQEGYGQRGVPPGHAPIVFPIDLIATEMAKDAVEFAVVDVQDPVRFLSPVEGQQDRYSLPGFWTILQDRYRDDLTRVAERVVVEGAEVALEGVPLGRFGELLTVDRREIESFRSIRAVVGEYCRRGERQKAPLSIAVFGTPGSGKSFGITQVASSLLPGRIEPMEFNLSQFDSEDDLRAALHQVRDLSLTGKIPLVFWDEFDTSLAGHGLGWLRHFLVPMQDGCFLEGQIRHSIGRAIFVFAGGTSTRMQDFDQGPDSKVFREAKGPDFLSRLKGYVDIEGLDPSDSHGTRSEPDPYFVLRRAIVLRSILKKEALQLFERPRKGDVTNSDPGVLNIDPGVLRAFLQTRRYKHGARSMAAIVAMSLLADKASYERSSLPSEAQLNLHVDGQDFLALVQMVDLEGPLLERMARAVHKVFCDSLRSKGYQWGPMTSEVEHTHSSLVSYDELPEEEKEQNLANARDIPNKLALSGYTMIPARSNQPPFNFPGSDLELLAEMEHERFVEAKLAMGWEYAAETDKAKKRHRSLVPWEELGDEDKEKDRELVRSIPRILARVGYTVVRVSKEADQG